MRKFRQWCALSLLILFMALPQFATAQLNIGIAAGVDVDLDATMFGLAANMDIAMLNVGLNAEYGEGDLESDACVGTALPDCSLTLEIIRFMVPLSYPIAIGESGFALYPFLAPGVFTWSCDVCDGTSEFSFDAGVRAQYNVAMAAASYGFTEEAPAWTFRLGFLFALGQ
jgi:hypothetical protein